jgi:glutathione S-transferase
MSLKLYHAEPAANSLKALIALKEKGLEFESIYVDLHNFQQHEPWFVAINPEGQVPVLDHDGDIINHTTVISEYLEDAFPDAPPLRPADPLGKARMRIWNKFVDEDVMNHTSLWGWHFIVTPTARSYDEEAFEKFLERIPKEDQRVKWRQAREGYSEESLAYAKRKVERAVDKSEAQLSQSEWLAGDTFSLADINLFCMLGFLLDRSFPDLAVRDRCPHLLDWTQRVLNRPGVQAALAMPGREEMAKKAASEG